MQNVMSDWVGGYLKVCVCVFVRESIKPVGTWRFICLLTRLLRAVCVCF